jgi:hypothetical protein
MALYPKLATVLLFTLSVLRLKYKYAIRNMKYI